MPYCVHCGVEMAPSEQTCPLCFTEVHDLSCPWVPPQKMPYPDRVEDLMRHINRKYARRLSLIVLLIPALVVLLVNFVATGGFSWSFYVVGGLVCFYCWVLVPMFYRFRRPYAYIVVAFTALALYLLLIAAMSGGRDWYLGIALPMIVAIAFLVQMILLAVRRLEWQPLERAAAVCVMLTAFLVAADAIIDLYFGKLDINWAIYAGLLLLALGAVFLVLEKKKGLKDAIKKRLFI